MCRAKNECRGSPPVGNPLPCSAPTASGGESGAGGELPHLNHTSHRVRREVEEETGVGNLTLIDFLGITQHQYFDPYLHEEVIKESHWYIMSAKGVPALIPQTEEDITDIRWVPLAEVNTLIANSYASIKEIIGLFFLKQPQ